MGAALLVVAGGSILFAGLNWEKFQPRISPRFTASIEQISVDARWWLGTLFGFIFLVLGPTIARDVPPSSRGIWFDRVVMAVITLASIGASSCSS